MAKKSSTNTKLDTIISNLHSLMSDLAEIEVKGDDRRAALEEADYDLRNALERIREAY